MVKSLVILMALLLTFAATEKRIATVDVIELSLKQNETKIVNQLLEEHHDWALMVNV
jgi:hypothetical protein